MKLNSLRILWYFNDIIILHLSEHNNKHSKLETNLIIENNSKKTVHEKNSKNKQLKKSYSYLQSALVFK